MFLLSWLFGQMQSVLPVPIIRIRSVPLMEIRRNTIEKYWIFVELQKEQNLIFWNLLEWWKKRFLNQDCDVRFADNAGGMTFAAAKKAAGRTYKIKMMVLQNKMINQVTNTAHNMKQIFRNL